MVSSCVEEFRLRVFGASRNHLLSPSFPLLSRRRTEPRFRAVATLVATRVPQAASGRAWVIFSSCSRVTVGENAGTDIACRPKAGAVCPAADQALVLLVATGLAGG